MFFLREICSVTNYADAATVIAAPRAVDALDEEPVMTRLGVALIELALGQSIQDMREEYVLDGMSDQDAVNVCRARALPENRRIRSEANRTYDGVVPGELYGYHYHAALSVVECPRKVLGSYYTIMGTGTPFSIAKSHSLFILLPWGCY
jgi:hypothetical protein